MKLDIVMKGHWLANGKRIPRYYSQINKTMYDNLIVALNCLYIEKSKYEFIEWVNQILNKYGSRLDDGYSRGK